MADLLIRKKEKKDNDWIKTIQIESWGSDRILLLGKTYIPGDLPALIAEQDDTRIGLLTFLIKNDKCEIITLNSLQPGLGIGTALIDGIKNIARDEGCSTLYLFTTNDNINAISFYQKNGFRLKTFIPNGVTSDRFIKPEIPELGENGIPIKDYIELEMELKV